MVINLSYQGNTLMILKLIKLVSIKNFKLLLIRNDIRYLNSLFYSRTIKYNEDHPRGSDPGAVSGGAGNSKLREISRRRKDGESARSAWGKSLTTPEPNSCLEYCVLIGQKKSFPIGGHNKSVSCVLIRSIHKGLFVRHICLAYSPRFCSRRTFSARASSVEKVGRLTVTLARKRRIIQIWVDHRTFYGDPLSDDLKEFIQ